jgi:hypothetical protein
MGMSPTVRVVVGVLVAVATAACDPCAPKERSVVERRMFESPLHEAVWRADAERVAELLAQGEDPNEAVEGGTALSVAVTAGNYSVVKTLLDTDADPNVGTSEGWTPLMVAAQFDRATLAAALLGAGADVNAQDNRGRTALMSPPPSGASRSRRPSWRPEPIRTSGRAMGAPR